MTVPELLLALRPLLAVLAVLFLLPRLFGRPFREFTGFLHDLRSLLRAAEESKKLGPTERSIPDVTKLFLPTINRDFPAFNWPEERVAIEKRIVSVLAARQALDLSNLSAPSESLRERVRLAIEDDRMNELTRSFSDIVIHKTAIADYKNQATLTEIRLVSSIGFTASLAGDAVRKSEGKARAARAGARRPPPRSPPGRDDRHFGSGPCPECQLQKRVSKDHRCLLSALRCAPAACRCEILSLL